MENRQSADAYAPHSGDRAPASVKHRQPLPSTTHKFSLDESGPRAQFSGKGKSQKEIAAGQEAAALSLKPAFGLILVTLRTGAIAAGVVRKDLLLTVIALIDMASKERRAASGNIPQSPFLNRTQDVAVLLLVRRAVEADDIGHLQPEDLGIRGPS
jgi:hypothetical protein